MTDSLFRRFGDADFPPDLTGSPETLTAALDPTHDAMIALFSAAINAEIGAAWDLAKVGTKLADKSPVADTLWRQPTKEALRQQGLQFPLLCLAPVSGNAESLTLQKEQLTTTWALDYLLGPLTGADYRRLSACLRAALKVLGSTVQELAHPSYEAGARQFAGMNTVGIGQWALGPASFGEDGQGVEYFGLHIDFETSETGAPLDGSVTDYVGASFVFGVGDANQILPDEIVAYTETPRSP